MLSRSFILYSIIGLSCLFIEIISFKILIDYKIHVLISNILSIYLASLLSFTLNGIYNFRKFDNRFKRYLIFVSVIILGSIVSTILLKIFSYIFTVMIAKFLTIPFVVILQYLLNKNFTFKLNFDEK